MPIGINAEDDLFIVLGKGDVGIATFKTEDHKGFCCRQLSKQYPIGEDLKTEEHSHEFHGENPTIHVIFEKVEDLAILKKAITSIENMFNKEVSEV